MFRALADATDDTSWREDEGSDYVLPGLAQTLREMAAGIDAFGQLVLDEAELAADSASPDVQLAGLLRLQQGGADLRDVVGDATRLIQPGPRCGAEVSSVGREPVQLLGGVVE